MSNFIAELDEYDRKIIKSLQEDGLATNAFLAEKVSLSPSAVNERIRKLKEKGVISKIAAFVNASAVHLELLAFIYVLVDTPGDSKNFLNSACAHHNVQECHHMTGEYSYLLKVRVRHTKELEDFISNFLKTQKGLSKTHTQIVLSSAKDGSTVISESRSS
jgi:Lrp/AsnC family leucine-responsive transcriptional regulator